MTPLISVLSSLRKKTEAEYKKWTSINYFVQSTDFEFIYEQASTEERKKLTTAIIGGNRQFLKKFIKEKKCDLTPFKKLSFRKLKAIGKFLRIPDYYNMSKSTLVEVIENEVQRIKANSKQIIGESK